MKFDHIRANISRVAIIIQHSITLDTLIFDDLSFLFPGLKF